MLPSNMEAINKNIDIQSDPWKNFVHLVKSVIWVSLKPIYLNETNLIVSF